MNDRIYVRLESSHAAVSVNYSGGCYLEFWNKSQPDSIAFTIATEDLQPLIEALRIAAKRSGMKAEE